MSSKVSLVKTGIVVIILGLVGVLGVLGMGTVRTYLSGATAGYEPKNVLPNIKDSEVTISWTTDKPAKGYIQYGTTPASLLLSVPSRDDLGNSSTQTSHSVSIKTFKPNTTYYFRLRMGTEIANYTEWEVFDNGGIPYSFKTKGIAAVAATPTIVPTPTVSSSPVLTGTEVSPTPVVGIHCQTGVDYNNDGVVNSIDMRVCLQQGGTVQTPTLGATPTGSTGTSTCQAGVDYNNDGVINSIDMLTCRQKSP